MYENVRDVGLRIGGDGGRIVTWGQKIRGGWEGRDK